MIWSETQKKGLTTSTGIRGIERHHVIAHHCQQQVWVTPTVPTTARVQLNTRLLHTTHTQHTHPRYSSGMGAAATSASMLRQTWEQSDTDLRQTGHDSMPLRCMSAKHSEWMVCPQRSTEVGRMESKRNSKQIGQLWCMLFSTHLWLSCTHVLGMQRASFPTRWHASKVHLPSHHHTITSSHHHTITPSHPQVDVVAATTGGAVEKIVSTADPADAASVAVKLLLGEVVVKKTAA